MLAKKNRPQEGLTIVLLTLIPVSNIYPLVLLVFTQSFISRPLLSFFPLIPNAKKHTFCCRAASPALCHLRGTRT